MLALSISCAVQAQEPAKPPTPDAPKAERSVTKHSLRIGGVALAYTATAGTFILRDAQSEPWARIGYTAYMKDGTEASARPITFAFNGGPGSSSTWLHLGALGPKRVVTVNAESTPPAPYRLVDNEESLLDVSDLVLIDPVGTGFSRAVGKAVDRDFWGVDPDIESISRFIAQFTSEAGRWNSPKYLLGESYGTTRGAGIADYLQTNLGLALNGVVLVSVAMDLQSIFLVPGNERPYAFFLPTYTAVAAYHHALPSEPKDLKALLEEARIFAMGPYAAALMKGDRLSDAELGALAQRVHDLTGLSIPYVKAARLRVGPDGFRQELLRSRGLTVGRIDARFTGPSQNPLAERAPWDPHGSAVMPAFIAAFMDYLQRDLKFGEGKDYHFMASLYQSWEFKHKVGNVTQPMVNTTPDLTHALLANPHLRVLVLNGLMDLATPFLATEYTMDHLDLPAAYRDHVAMKYFDSGHMMYLHEPELKQMKREIADFIKLTTHS
jgi:carboxypeptidase C (cathepsin A)